MGNKMIFSTGELQRRFQAFSQGLVERNVDVAFLTTADHVYYISGVPLLNAWGRPMWAVVYPYGKACLMGALGEKENMEERTWFPDVRAFDDSATALDSSMSMVSDYLKNSGVPNKRIGIETEFMTLPVYNRLTALFPDSEFVDISDILFELRAVKSKEELEIMRVGAEVAKIGASAYIESAGEFRTELSMAGYALNEMNKAIAALYPQYMGGATMSYIYGYHGENSMIYHMLPTNRRLKRGDLISFCMMPNIWGYQMEFGRFFFLGEPTDAQLKVYAAVTKANEIARAMYKAGAIPSKIDAAAYDYLRELGYGKYIRHGNGHALGLMIGPAGREEICEIRSYNHRPLKAGMVVNCEPALYIPELGGAYRHVDTMVITEDGHELLSRFVHDINGLLEYNTLDFEYR